MSCQKASRSSGDGFVFGPNIALNDLSNVRFVESELVDERPERAQEQLLNQPCFVRLWKEPTVEQAQGQPLPRALPFGLPRQQLLGDGITIVVSQDVKPLELAVRDQCLAQVRLFHDAVGVGVGLIAETKPQHVQRHQTIRFVECSPNGHPIPR
jgi:hypothetical protein